MRDIVAEMSSDVVIFKGSKWPMLVRLVAGYHERNNMIRFVNWPTFNGLLRRGVIEVDPKHERFYRLKQPA